MRFLSLSKNRNWIWGTHWLPEALSTGARGEGQSDRAVNLTTHSKLVPRVHIHKWSYASLPHTLTHPRCQTSPADKWTWRHRTPKVPDSLLYRELPWFSSVPSSTSQDNTSVYCIRTQPFVIHNLPDYWPTTPSADITRNQLLQLSSTTLQIEIWMWDNIVSLEMKNTVSLCLVKYQAKKECEGVEAQRHALFIPAVGRVSFTPTAVWLREKRLRIWASNLFWSTATTLIGGRKFKNSNRWHTQTLK